MFRRIAAALAFTCLVLVAAPATAQQVPEMSIEARQSFIVYLQRVSALLEQAGRAQQSMNGLNEAIRSPNLAERRAALREIGRLSAEARVALASIRIELDALPAPREGLTPDLVEMGEAVRQDSLTFFDNIDATLGNVVAFVAAFDAGNAAEVQRLGPRLVESASLLVRGQIVMLRARQHMFSEEESTYHSLGGMVALYEGMRALIFMEGADRVAGLNAAADAAAGWAASGRAAVAAERQESAQAFVSVAAQQLATQVHDYDARTFDLVERVGVTLRSSAASAAQNVPAAQLRQQYVAILSEHEAEFQTLNQEQMVVISQLTSLPE